MKVTLLQIDSKWMDERGNILRATALMDSLPGSDLYVLPEMWSTGFVTDTMENVPDEKHSVALQWMKEEAARRRCAICGSLAVRDDEGAYRNRLYFVDGRHDRVAYYDKHHLFSYGGENLHYTPGQHHTIVAYEGMRILLLTCYDLRFPCWIRYADDRAYDVILLVANWPQGRQSAWQILTAARAIENQSYFIGVNRVGDDLVTHYIGGSCAIDPIGRTMVSLGDTAEAVSVALSQSEQLRRREKFPVLDDRD